MSLDLESLARRGVSKIARTVSPESSHVDKWTPATKAALLSLFHQYGQMAHDGKRLPSVFDVGLRVFSEFEEDGILLFLFAVLGTRSKTFVDVGSADGLRSNCANFAINLGWDGLFVDGEPKRLSLGRKIYARNPDVFLYPPQFVQGMVNRETVNEIISSAGFSGEVDLLSIDIDGNDYWVWHALEAVKPRVVVIETHVEFGRRNIVVPYDPDYVFPGRHEDYHGASPVAMKALAESLGYRLVACNRFGFNTIYIRADEGVGLLPDISIDDVLRHPRNADRSRRFDSVRSYPYVLGGSGYPGTPVPPDDLRASPPTRPRAE